MGASPETLVKLQDGVLRTFPLAGSRPRGKTPDEDAALERELLADPKELSEHNMLVDLGKSDLGKVSVIGSVDVEELRTVVRYSHIMHISSTVRVIRPGRTRRRRRGGRLRHAKRAEVARLPTINGLRGQARGLYGG